MTLFTLMLDLVGLRGPHIPDDADPLSSSQTLNLLLSESPFPPREELFPSAQMFSEFPNGFDCNQESVQNTPDRGPDL